jgi:5-methyltetrahydropteroyltriglutamate--homocysteine methyltransferase
LPRPSWYTENLGTKSFLDAMTNNKFREQYTDALACYLRDQEVAGLDIVTDGDCRFDQDVGGQTWTSYPPRHMKGFEAHIRSWRARARAASAFRADISCMTISKPRDAEDCRAREPGEMQYAEIWKAAQRLTPRPVKFGTVAPELVAYAVQDEHYKDLPSRIMALSDAFNKELHDLADAVVPVIRSRIRNCTSWPLGPWPTKTSHSISCSRCSITP